jgi:hypothetical protein
LADGEKYLWSTHNKSIFKKKIDSRPMSHKGAVFDAIFRSNIHRPTGSPDENQVNINKKVLRKDIALYVGAETVDLFPQVTWIASRHIFHT